MNKPAKPAEVMNFGEYIRILRLSKHLSLSDAARKLKMKPQRLCDIESGRRLNRKVPMELVMNLAKLYSIPVADIAANIESAVQADKTASELMEEIQPNIRMAELMVVQLVELCKTYPSELERLATETAKYVKNTRLLIFAMRKRYFNTEKNAALEDESS
jgi:transcriptional regulator with XRE-family HTH domain